MEHLSFPIDVTSVSAPDDHDGQDIIGDGIDDAIGALANAISIMMTGELLTTRRSRIVSEPADSVNDPKPDLPRFYRFDFLCSGSLEADLIACHCA